MINDGNCDEECNVETCFYDGNRFTMLSWEDPSYTPGDCDYGNDECFTKESGADYRGSKNTTEDGDECLVWDHKKFKSQKGDEEFLGGHNHCRNPKVGGRRRDRPWCWKASLEGKGGREFVEGKPWGYCNVGNASKACGDQSLSASVKKVCPVAHDLWTFVARSSLACPMQVIREVSNEAASAPLIATISSVGALVLLGLLASMYIKLKRHREAYTLLQQKVQANLELSEMTRVGDLGTGPDEAEVLRVVAVTKTAR